MNNNDFIGVFDSGFGGLSVLKGLVEKLPNENYIFLADSKNAPYGKRSTEEIQDLVNKAIMTLKKQDGNMKLLVLACNTATVQALEQMNQLHPDLAIIGTKPRFDTVIMPNTTLKSKISTFNFKNGNLNVDVDKNKQKVLVLCTPATKNSSYLKKEISQFKKFFDIEVIAAPEIVEYVEDIKTDSPECEEYIQNILYNVKNIDYLMLGCTHFPFVLNIIKKYIDENVKIIDNANATIESSVEYLKLKNLISDNNQNNYIKIIDTANEVERQAIYKKMLNNENIIFI